MKIYGEKFGGEAKRKRRGGVKKGSIEEVGVDGRG